MEKKDFVHIFEGVLRGFFLTLMLLIIYAIIVTYGNVGDSFKNVSLLVISMISVLYACIYASKKIGKKGYLVGLLVSLFYMLIVYIISVITGGSPSIGAASLIRLALCLFVGMLSGMLGINL